MERIETLFSDQSNFDNKSILNKLDKCIDQSILDRIERGITLEDIEMLTQAGIPILKYRTQITIHGLFPELSNNYIFGYKNIFQNKNKSIGVKYNAIDEDKRKRIAERLKILGFVYHRNSQGTNFEIINSVNQDNFNTIKNHLFDLKNKIDNTLFYGYCDIWRGQAFGINYLCLSLNINAIYEANVEPFLNKIGATMELYNNYIEQKEAEQKECYEQLKKDREEAEEKKKQSLANKTEELNILQQFPRIEKINEPGVYILRHYNYDNELIFRLVYIYMIKGKKKPRWNKKDFLTVNEALNYKPEIHWSDGIYSSKLTGYKIA
jgi:hypothetical protein